jgi:hypothetical protein
VRGEVEGGDIPSDGGADQWATMAGSWCSDRDERGRDTMHREKKAGVALRRYGHILVERREMVTLGRERG